MIDKIILGHTLTELPKLPAELVNCCVTSPPYWGLRDYGIEPVIWDGDKVCEHDFDNINRLHPTRGGRGQGLDKKYPIRQSQQPTKINSNFCLKCNAWRGSLGLEPTFELYIKHLCDIFDEVKRVLRKDGTCWVNMGDSYWGSGQGGADYGGKEIIPESNFGHIARGRNYSNKSLCLIPQRFVIEMLNRGWILRNTLIWHKPNCMPSSAKDRFTVDFEYIYFFVKSKKYWFEQQFEKYEQEVNKVGVNMTLQNEALSYFKEKPTYNKFRDWYENKIQTSKFTTVRSRKGMGEGNSLAIYYKIFGRNEQGRNKRAVWTIPTQPFPEAHFAVYPEALIEPMIRAGCPEFVCKRCGKARVKIYKTEMNPDKVPKKWRKTYKGKVELEGSPTKRSVSELYAESLAKEKILAGYTDCGCNAGFEGGIIIDPFMGAGTTAVVAKKQGKKYIGIEIKQEYIEMANNRIRKISETLF